jgi:hypothetical protein
MTNEPRSSSPEIRRRATRSVLACGGQRSATPLWARTRTEANEENEGFVLRFLCCLLSNTSGRKRRRRCALPAQSKTWRALFAMGVLSAGLCLPAVAQLAIPWHTIAGGGGVSTGGVYAVTGTLGQPDAGGPLTGGHFSLTGGFWALPQLVQTPGAPTLYVTNSAPGWVTLWWAPDTGTNWVLQERPSLTSGSWINSPSGPTNPVTVQATLPAKFYRLHKP